MPWNDLVGRLGGEEFCLVSQGIGAGQECQVADCLRARTERDLGCVLGHPTKVTISIGLATHVAGRTDLAALLKEADAALYEAKRLGRNRVVAACRPVA